MPPSVPTATTVSRGFPAVASADARLLILGSLPGLRSIAAQEYYAHPQNAFWRIMREIHGIDGDYAQRCRQLQERGIALWDVLASSVRPGSLDADIRLDTATPNDFKGFLAVHRRVGRILFNGRKAEQMFRRLVLPGLGADVPELCPMPSTSPAYAAMPYARKLERWRTMATVQEKYENEGGSDDRLRNTGHQ